MTRGRVRWGYIAGMAVGSGRTFEDVARELRVAIAEAGQSED